MDLNLLIANLQNADPSLRAAAAEQLAHLAEEARPAAVSLVEAMGDTDNTVRDWAYAALESLGPPPANEAAALAKLAEDPRLDVAYWAVILLGRLAADVGLASTDATPLVTALTDALLNHTEIAVRERAAWALGKFGPLAASARRALEQAASDSRPRLSRLAHEALETLRKRDLP